MRRSFNYTQAISLFAIFLLIIVISWFEAGRWIASLEKSAYERGSMETLAKLIESTKKCIPIDIFAGPSTTTILSTNCWPSGEKVRDATSEDAAKAFQDMDNRRMGLSPDGKSVP
jgi:hypothetical protein